MPLGATVSNALWAEDDMRLFIGLSTGEVVEHIMCEGFPSRVFAQGPEGLVGFHLWNEYFARGP